MTHALPRSKGLFISSFTLWQVTARARSHPAPHSITAVALIQFREYSASLNTPDDAILCVMGIPNHDSDEIPLDNIKADTNTSMEFSCFYTHNMGLKPILVLSLMLYSTCFGAIRLLKDIENFKKDILTFLLPPPLPSQDLKYPPTQRPDTAIQHPGCFDVSNQGWEPVTNPNSLPQIQELQQDYDQQITTFKPEVSTSADRTLYREDLLNKRKLHDKTQRMGSGNCIGNKFCSQLMDIEQLK